MTRGRAIPYALDLFATENTEKTQTKESSRQRLRRLYDFRLISVPSVAENR